MSWLCSGETNFQLDYDSVMFLICGTVEGTLLSFDLYENGNIVRYLKTSRGKAIFNGTARFVIPWAHNCRFKF